MFLLDTMAVSEVRRPRPDRGYMAWLDRQFVDDLFTSTLSLAEIRRGILKTAHFGDPKILIDMETWFQHAILDHFEGRLLAFDRAAAEAWAAMTFDWPRGTTLPVMDSQIAAIGRAHGLTVVTRNTRDFRLFEERGVKLLNPWLD